MTQTTTVSSISIVDDISTTLQDAVATMTAALPEPRISPPAVVAVPLPSLPTPTLTPVGASSPVSIPVQPELPPVVAGGLAVSLGPAVEPLFTVAPVASPGTPPDAGPQALAAPAGADPLSVETPETTGVPQRAAPSALPISPAPRTTHRRVRQGATDSGRTQRLRFLPAPGHAAAAVPERRPEAAFRPAAHAPIGDPGRLKALLPIGVRGGTIEPPNTRAQHRARDDDAVPPVPQLPGQGSDLASGAAAHGSSSPGGGFAAALATFVFLLPALAHRLWASGGRRPRLLRAGRLERPG